MASEGALHLQCSKRRQIHPGRESQSRAAPDDLQKQLLNDSFVTETLIIIIIIHSAWSRVRVQTSDHLPTDSQTRNSGAEIGAEIRTDPQCKSWFQQCKIPLVFREQESLWEKSQCQEPRPGKLTDGVGR